MLKLFSAVGDAGDSRKGFRQAQRAAIALGIAHNLPCDAQGWLAWTIYTSWLWQDDENGKTRLTKFRM